MSLAQPDIGPIPVIAESSTFRALLWKEWREMRRQFWGCIFIFIVLPGVLGVIYYILSGYIDALHMGVMGLGGLACAPLAAAWGAHAVCRDLTTKRAGFILSRPLSSRLLLFTKAILAIFLYSIVFVLGCAFVIIVAYAVIDDASTEMEFEITPLLFLLVGLQGVMASSFLAAVLVRRFVPAVLVGLVAAVFLIVVPAVVNDYLGPWTEGADHSWIIRRLVAISVVLIALSCLFGWRQDRAQLSNRTIAWAAVVMLLALTLSISNSLATDTVVVSSFNISSEVIASDENGVYWMSVRLYDKKNFGRIICRTRIHVDGRYGETQEIRLNGIDANLPGRYPEFLLQDGELLVSITESRRQSQELLRFKLDFDVPESQSQQLFQFDGSPGTSWTQFNGKYYCLRSVRDGIGSGYVTLHCYSEINGKLSLDSVSTSLFPNESAIDVVNGRLSIVSQEQVRRGQVEFRHCFVNDLGTKGVYFTSGMIPIAISDYISVHRPGGLVGYASNGDRIAISTPKGIGLYRIDNNGNFEELGRRYAGPIEYLAGRDTWALSWHGNRLFERTTFGLIIYDTSSGKPRRVGCLRNYAYAVVGVDDQHFVVTGQRGFEVHRLPE